MIIFKHIIFIFLLFHIFSLIANQIYKNDFFCLSEKIDDFLCNLENKSKLYKIFLNCIFPVWGYIAILGILSGILIVCIIASIVFGIPIVLYYLLFRHL
jgi:hypothetical protein